MVVYPDEIEYSDKYSDSLYEYRHVILPKYVARQLYRITLGKRLLLEAEWRSAGVQMTRGWTHYEVHAPEPHILLFRRLLGTDPQNGTAATKKLEVFQQLETLDFPGQIEYSEKFQDDLYEYRYVILTKEVATKMFELLNDKKTTLGEVDWRDLGITMSKGWIHHESYQPHTMLFKRPLGTDPRNGTALTKVLTVHCSWIGSLVHLSCSNMGGEEEVVWDLPATESVSSLIERLSLCLQLAPERLKLLMPCGKMLSKEDTQTLAALTSSVRHKI